MIRNKMSQSSFSDFEKYKTAMRRKKDNELNKITPNHKIMEEKKILN